MLLRHKCSASTPGVVSIVSIPSFLLFNQILSLAWSYDDSIRPSKRRISVENRSRTWTAQASTPQGLQGSRPPIFELHGSSCVDDPPIFWQVFYFFPFGGTSEYCKSLSFSYAPYHTILRRKILKFSGKGHSPFPDLIPLAASILASSALDLRPPQCSSGVDAYKRGLSCLLVHWNTASLPRPYREYDGAHQCTIPRRLVALRCTISPARRYAVLRPCACLSVTSQCSTETDGRIELVSAWRLHSTYPTLF